MIRCLLLLLLLAFTADANQVVRSERYAESAKPSSQNRHVAVHVHANGHSHVDAKSQINHRKKHVKANSIKVLYSVGAGTGQQDKVRAVLRTWAAKLSPGQLQIIGLKEPKTKDSTVFAPEEVARASWNAAKMCSDSHDGGACKDVVGLESGFSKGADWVVLVGADNYVVTRNLEPELAKHDPAVPQVLGIKGCGDCAGGGLCGGGGQVFSRAALEKMMEKGTQQFFSEEQHAAQVVGMWGDVANCQVATNHGVPLHDLPGLNGWRVSTAELQEKLHRKSPKAFTFHYVGPDEMQTYQAMVDGIQEFVHSAETDAEKSASEAVESAFGLASWYEERARYIASEEIRRKKRSVGSLVLDSAEMTLTHKRSSSRPAAKESHHHNASASPSILFSIAAGSKQLHSVETALSTWAGHLSPERVQVVGISRPADDGLAGLAYWDQATQCEDNHAAGACKDVAGLVDGYRKGHDWVVLVGADNYVVTRNLEHELAKWNPNEPQVLGIKGCGACSGGGLCGGGGQIFSKAALKKMMASGSSEFIAEEKSSAQAVGMWGDVANCVVATNHKVPLHNLPGLYGWKLTSEALTTKIQTKEPSALIFHYLSADDMRRTHGIVGHFHQLYQSTAEDRAAEALGLARWYHERATYIQEEQDARQLRPFFGVF